METPRKIGIGIVLIVPAFVLAGLVWSIFESWIAVIVLVVLMGFFYKTLLGKLDSDLRSA